MKYNITGLTKEEVKKMEEAGEVNYESEIKTKSISQIILTNFLTLFNFLNLFLAIIVFMVGSYKNLLFIGVVICNTLISTIQEIRSKLTIDKLSLLEENTTTVIRNGKEEKINIHKIVKNDICKYTMGNQISTDGIVLGGKAFVNESLITGEAEPVEKNKGDELLSGTFIVSGKVYAKTIHVGSENYSAKISREAKYLKKVNSEIMNFVKKIIKYISITIVPIGIILYIHQLNIVGMQNQNEAILNVVAALIGMIPEGLVLLTSTVLAISVIRLSKYNVLVREIYCIETLARVDTICLDKTGTITCANMYVSDIIPLNMTSKSDIIDALGIMSYHMKDDNETMKAISDKYSRENDYKIKNIVPFSSVNKWSGLSLESESYVLGAPEVILKDTSIIKEELNNYIENSRVVLLCKTKEILDKTLPTSLEPMGLILINDKIRKDAKSTLDFFKKQGVDIKIISGDNPKTVASIAKKVGLSNVKYVDMSSTKSQIKDLIKEYNVFGRVKPEQKREIIKCLKQDGHTVAMTGDGVNDVLALRESDCSIAINSGSDAARNVSDLVLLDSKFSSMPKVVAEGRRSINNLQRSASLFLCKTTYATLLAIIFIFLNTTYPFVPIQLTLTSMVTIGIPSFILALEPNNDRIQGNIMFNVMKKALPTALTIVANIVIISFLPNIINISTEEVSTLAVVLTGFTGFTLLYRLSVPFNTLRKVLFVSLIILFTFGIIVLKDLFSLTILSFHLIILALILLMIAIMLFNLFAAIIDKFLNKKI